MIGDTATVVVDGELFTGDVYHVRENGWPCVRTESGRQASGPIAGTETGEERSLDTMLEEHGWRRKRWTVQPTFGPYWEVLRNGEVIDTYPNAELAQAYADFCNAREVNGQ